MSSRTGGKKLGAAWALLAILGGVALAEPPQGAPDGEELLRAVDANIGSDNKVTTARMEIHGRRGTRTVRLRSWLQGMERSFTEYLDPPREKGTKMLKLGDQLWIYTPASDRTIRISGHMLRQSVMGSDLSYEDLMEDPTLHRLYSATVTEADTLAERPCWVLDLEARKEDLAYASRRIWVDQERRVILREHRYAKSGRLLKTTDVEDVITQQGRWVPSRVLFRDALKSGAGTRFVLETIEFDAEIPQHLFSKAALRR